MRQYTYIRRKGAEEEGKGESGKAQHLRMLSIKLVLLALLAAVGARRTFHSALDAVQLYCTGASTDLNLSYDEYVAGATLYNEVSPVGSVKV